MKITKRDVKVFLLGMLTFLLLETVFYWDKAVADFKAGFRDATNSQQDSKSLIKLLGRII